MSHHLHLLIEKYKYSIFGKYLSDEQNRTPINLHEQFVILRKCHGKFECLIYEMLLMSKKRPNLYNNNNNNNNPFI